MRVSRLALFALVTLAGLAVYLTTLHPDLQPADSGEFQLVAILAGVAHPPGYPLYTILGWIASQIPISTVYARVSGVSALAAALTLGLVALTVVEVAVADGRRRWLAALAGVAAAAALGTATTFWAQATTTNIRALTAFFTALMVFATARATQRKPSLMLFALAAGLGVGHHVSLVFPAIVLGAYVLWIAVRRDAPSPRQAIGPLAQAAVLLLATQVVWLYLPLRDNAGAVLAPGTLRTFDGLLAHITARGFEGDMLYFVRTEPERLWDRLSLLPSLLRFQFSQPMLGLLGVALVAALIRFRSFAALLLAAFALHMFITLTYRAPQTVEYAMPCWVIAAVLLGIGLFGLLPTGDVPAPLITPGKASGRSGGRRAAVMNSVVLRTRLRAVFSLGVMLAVLAVALVDGLGKWPGFVAASQNRETRDNATSVLKYAQVSGVILAQWHEYTPMIALQQVENLQPRVKVEYVYPRGAQPYGETFAERSLEYSGNFGLAYVTSLFDAEFAQLGLQTFPLSNTPAWRIGPDIAIYGSYDATIFDDRIYVIAPVGLNNALVEAGQSIPIDIWWRTRGEHKSGDAVTVRILRPDGKLAANVDLSMDGSDRFGAYVTRRLMLSLPPDLDPGFYGVLVGAYNNGANGIISYRDSNGDTFAQTAFLEVIPAVLPPATQRPIGELCFSDCPAPGLIGVDYDLGVPGRVRLYTHWRVGPAEVPVEIVNARGQALAAERRLPAGGGYFTLAFDIPPERQLTARVGNLRIPLADYVDGERYVPFGEQMALIGVQADRARAQVELTWLGARNITHDYIVSVQTEADGTQRQHDSVPALGAIPTLKWMRHARVVDRHPIELTGATRGRVIVYDSVSRIPLQIADERYEGGFYFDIAP
jgi:Protein of unknown function (DUF2723)